MKRTISAIVLALLLMVAPATAAAYSYSSHSYSSHSYSSPHYSSPSTHVSTPSTSHSSSSESESHPSSSSSSTRSTGSTSRTSTPSYHATTYNGRTYNQNSSSNSYFNVTGILIAYWIYNDSTHSYSCYDSNHTETSCNRNSGTVTHNGQTYSVSDKQYTNTAGKTVAFYQKKTDSKKKTYFECFQSDYTRTTCNRK